MSGRKPAPDQQDRDAAVHARDVNVIADAGAGTGKTTLLVARLVELVAPADDGPAFVLGRVAAITFTRKAAAEMRERILETLARAAAEGGLDERRWRSLRERLPEVAISTIDAFCLSLLREFPLEAGLAPDADQITTRAQGVNAIDAAIVSPEHL